MTSGIDRIITSFWHFGTAFRQLSKGLKSLKDNNQLPEFLQNTAAPPQNNEQKEEDSTNSQTDTESSESDVEQCEALTHLDRASAEDPEEIIESIPEKRLIRFACASGQN